MLSSTLLLLLAATEPTHLSLVFAGDVIPHGEVKLAAEAHARSSPKEEGPVRSLNNEGWDELFAPLADTFRSADLAVVNLETPVTTARKPFTGPLIFNAPPAMLQALAHSGVRAVSLANNHARDQHLAGLVETHQHLAAAGLKGAGTGPTAAAAWEPLLLQVRGVNVGLLSFTRLLNYFRNPESQEEPHVAYVPYAATPEEAHKAQGLSTDELLERVRAAAARCEALFVLVHWGTEYQSQPRAEDRTLAQALFEAGALAVIGHHPHVLQPVEYQRTSSGRRTLVAFSLGNLIANQDRHYVHGAPLRRGDKRDSLLLRVQLVRREPGAPVELESASLLPVWIDNNREQRLRGDRVPRLIQPVLIDSELQAATEQLAALEAQGPARDKKERQARQELERRKALLQSRRERILQLMPPELVAGSSAPPAPPPGG